MERIKNPLVSVIMPFFNASKYLREAIQSVLDQTYSNLELLIINDGSTDDSERITMGFNDKRVSYFKQINRGVSAARNVGLKNMQGDFFCFLDADDIYPKHSIMARMEVFFTGLRELEFVDGRVEERDSELKNTHRIYQPAFRGNPENVMLRISEKSYSRLSWLIRRRYDKEYAMNEHLTHGEDFLFLLNLARAGGLYDYTNQTILLYRKHSLSAMSNLDGLNHGYLLIHKEIRDWKEVSFVTSFFFWLKSRKIMFLSFLFNDKSLFKAIRSLLQWK